MDLKVPRLLGPFRDFQADKRFIGDGPKNMNRRDWGSLRLGRQGRNSRFSRFGRGTGFYRKRLEGSSEKIWPSRIWTTR